MRGIDVGETRWQRVVDAVSPQIGKPTVTWYYNYSKQTDRHTYIQTDRTYSFLFVVRYTCHLMMGLSYGKVCESTTRLALARQMIEVSYHAFSFSSSTWDILVLLKSVEQYAESGLSTDCDIAAMVRRNNSMLYHTLSLLSLMQRKGVGHKTHSLLFPLLLLLLLCLFSSIVYSWVYQSAMLCLHMENSDTARWGEVTDKPCDLLLHPCSPSSGGQSAVTTAIWLCSTGRQLGSKTNFLNHTHPCSHQRQPATASFVSHS